jgi:LPXTG-motif cell wall-anchored protein
VLGDIDADMVEIAATDADGNPVSADDLGFSGVFNYCAVSPKPSGCSGPGPFTDVPTWHPGSSRLVGNGPDTLGSAGWFQPKVPIKSLTFTFTALTGIPIYQVWLTTLSVPVETKVDGITPANPVPAPGVEIDLLEQDGVTPVEQPDGAPVIEVADPKGDVVFPAVADGDYVLKIVPPKHVRTLGKTTVPITVDVTQGSPTVPSNTFRLVVPLQLAKTGTDAAPAIGAGLALLTLGGLLVWFGRRRTTRGTE